MKYRIETDRERQDAEREGASDAAPLDVGEDCGLTEREGCGEGEWRLHRVDRRCRRGLCIVPVAHAEGCRVITIEAPLRQNRRRCRTRSSHGGAQWQWYLE
jgi:hypothetical protein